MMFGFQEKWTSKRVRFRIHEWMIESAISPNDIRIFGPFFTKNKAVLVKTLKYHSENAAQKAVKPQQKIR